MPYSEALAQRIRDVLSDSDGITERKMFGGIAFMVRGNMLCGIVREDLMVRTGHECFEEALSRPHARPMDFTGRPMKGMVYVSPQGFASDADLSSWVGTGLAFASSLPPK